MTNIVRLLHRYVGFIVGIVFLLALFSAIIIAWDYLQKDLDTAFQARPQLSSADLAVGLYELQDKATNARSITLPSSESPFFEIRGRGSSQRFSAEDYTLVEHIERPRDSFYSSMISLHRNLMLGRQDIFFKVGGNDIVAWASMIGVVLSVLGIWLWWFFRKSFKPSSFAPRSFRRGVLIKAHAHYSIVLLIPLVFYALSGAAITYRDEARQMLDPHDSKIQQRAHPYYLNASWLSWINAAQREFPHGELVAVSMGRQRGGQQANFGDTSTRGAITLTFKTSANWFGIPDSKVYISRSQSAIVGKLDFARLSFAQKLHNTMVALHTGRTSSTGYLLLILLFCGIAFLIVLVSMISFTRLHLKKFKK